AAGIPTWSPTVVLICRSTAYVWQSGRDAQFSADCGRMKQQRICDTDLLNDGLRSDLRTSPTKGEKHIIPCRLVSQSMTSI
ncbi:hypothetical protein KCU81_g1, partial [Aureobasidium melanogenum]